MGSLTDSGVEDVTLDLTTEEGGQLAVSAVDELHPDVGTDAVPFSSALDYDKFITESDLQAIEKDLFPEEVARLLFLAVDDTPGHVLQKCRVKMSHDQRSQNTIADSFSEWARTISSECSWKALFLESLGAIERLDVLHCLRCDESEIRRLQKPVHLSPLKVSLNCVCCSLEQRETNDLIQYVWQHHLPGRQEKTFPDGNIIKPLLELHILYWMQEGIILLWMQEGTMDLINMSVLVEALEHIGRPELKDVLIGHPSPSLTISPSISPSISLNSELTSGEHSRVSSLSSLTGVPDFVYPNDKGLCIIFNQEVFFCENPECPLKGMKNHGQRKGSSKDVQNLEKVFGNLQCSTKIFNNMRGPQIQSILKSLAKARNLKQFDFLVVCFLSHGDKGDHGQYIYSYDCLELYIDDLIRPFQGDQCPDMRGKMKMIITQSCQGPNRLLPLHPDGPSDSTQSSTSFSRSVSATAQSDFLFCQSATPGYVAWRHPELGSPYIRYLCEVLDSRGHLEEVTLCIKFVHKLVIEKPVSVREKEQERYWLRAYAIQPQITDRLQGFFRFKRRAELVQPQSV